MHNVNNESIDIKSIEKCRAIVNEINMFGVSEKERIKIIDLLAFELENVNMMRKIHNIIKESKDKLYCSDDDELENTSTKKSLLI